MTPKRNSPRFKSEILMTYSFEQGSRDALEQGISFIRYCSSFCRQDNVTEVSAILEGAQSSPNGGNHKIREINSSDITLPLLSSEITLTDQWRENWLVTFDDSKNKLVTFPHSCFIFVAVFQQFYNKLFNIMISPDIIMYRNLQLFIHYTLLFKLRRNAKTRDKFLGIYYDLEQNYLISTSLYLVTKELYFSSTFIFVIIYFFSQASNIQDIIQ